MPFTFSHPAAVLPLKHFFKRWLSLTGLIAGSLVPDFEYFVRSFHESEYSHTWAGLFYVDLPAGLLLCFVYHNLVRRPFYAHAPLFVKRRLAAFQWFRWNRYFARHWPVVLFSILVGAFSHLVWDKVLHHSVPVMQSVSGSERLTRPDVYEMAYSLVWDTNSVVGILVLMYAFLALPSRKAVEANESIIRYWLLLGGCTVLLFVLQLLYPREKELSDVVIFFINAFLLSLLLNSFLFASRSQSPRTISSGAQKEREPFRSPS